MTDFSILEEDIDESFLPNLPRATSPASAQDDEDDVFALDSDLTSQAQDSSPAPSRKERRLPSITPQKFTRFFTPRSLRTPRRALFDIPAPGPNDRGVQSSPLRPYSFVHGSFVQGLESSSPDPFARVLKRRKVSHPAGTPDENGKPNKRNGGSTSISEEETEEETEPVKLPDPIRLSAFKRAARRNVDTEIIAQVVSTPKQKTVLEERGLSGRLLQMSFGSGPRNRRTAHAVGDWQDETANFYTSPLDTHLCNMPASGDAALPFCTATCNRSTLIALGDEHGQVKILESEQEGVPHFSSSYLAFKHHTNAIFDLSFSQDDSLLATASADQSAKVTDMRTQQTISTLAQHTASVKQVRFQPGASNNSVLATSSRDGSIEIWDLRCRGNGGSVREIFQPNDPILSRIGRPGYGYAINSLYDAHKAYVPPTAMTDKAQRRTSGRAGVPSVTTISFMPEGQEHLLLSASEHNACVRVWDIRALYQTHKEWAVPLSQTRQPSSHNNWRQFGVVSMNLGGDGSRLYTLCKDSTIYTYSTAHLILGHAPELSLTGNSRWRRPVETSREGAGPIYGFRHPALLTSSFYVKTDLRPEKDGKCEMLAVGSSKDGNAILIPTDERYHDFSLEDGSEVARPNLRRRPTLTRRTTSGQIINADDEIPISQNGTALINGHEKEVSSLAWTSNGELITLSDDYLVRCWREDREEARGLRVGGEAGGNRWESGWADVKDDYDDDDEEC